MDGKPVRIVSWQPHKVVYEDVRTGERVEVPRGYFEKRLEMGRYEVLNPEALPAPF